MGRLLRLAILTFFIIAISCSGCATDRQVRKIVGKANSSCDLAHMGKNKYYYTNHYKRILSGNNRKIAKK